MQFIGHTVKFNRMAGIVSTLITCNDFRVFTQKVRNLSFTFIAPLCTYYYYR